MGKMQVPTEPDPDRERFIAAALEILRASGPAALSLRRVAEQAGISTMGIYSRFGNRMGLLEAVHSRGFEMLRERLLAAREGEPPEAIEPLIHAYREHALQNPVLYGLMFERPLPDFEPSPEARAVALGQTFSILLEAVAARLALSPDGAARPAYIIWTALHGMVSI
jgi:AcrR family transcriptional regulator